MLSPNTVSSDQSIVKKHLSVMPSVNSVLCNFQLQIRHNSTSLDNNNVLKYPSDRYSPPPGTMPIHERLLAKSSSKMTCKGEGQFVPEDDDPVISRVSRGNRKVRKLYVKEWGQ